MPYIEDYAQSKANDHGSTKWSNMNSADAMLKHIRDVVFRFSIDSLHLFD